MLRLSISQFDPNGSEVLTFDGIKVCGNRVNRHIRAVGDSQTIATRYHD
jgi:hypothetical protein